METAVLTSAGPMRRTAASASLSVSPVSQVSSTINTRRPLTLGGGAVTKVGLTPSRTRVTAMEAKSRCNIEATTAPGITPALAIPKTSSGSKEPATLNARARHNSPKSGQPTSKTSLLGGVGVWRRMVTLP